MKRRQLRRLARRVDHAAPAVDWEQIAGWLDSIGGHSCWLTRRVWESLRHMGCVLPPLAPACAAERHEPGPVYIIGWGGEDEDGTLEETE